MKNILIRIFSIMLGIAALIGIKVMDFSALITILLVVVVLILFIFILAGPFSKEKSTDE